MAKKRAYKATEEISPIRVKMESPDVILPMFRCRYCSHEWIPRQNIPKECPNCKRRNWYGKPEEDED